MMYFIGFAILAMLCYILNKHIYSYWTSKKLLQYPGGYLPFGNLKIIGKNVTSMGMQFRDIYKFFRKNGSKHGGAYIFQIPIYVPCDMDIIKSILMKDYSHFNEKGLYYNEKGHPTEANIFNIGGDRWKNIRTKLTPAFTSGKIKTMYPIILQCSENMVNSIQEDQVIDIKDLSACYTTDNIGSCAFGIDCNSFKDRHSTFRYYGDMVANLPLSIQILTPILFAFPKFCKALNLTQFPLDLYNFFTGVITDNVKYRENNHISRNDLLQMQIEIKNQSKLSLTEIVSQSTLFFFAGFETSSTAMTHLLMELCVNPDIQEKCRHEMFKVLKEHNNQLTYECVMDMKYLEQCFYETLRKYPALPVLNRECSKTYTVPGTNLVLDPGTKVFVPLMGIHYDPEYYPDPEKFDPDRFTEENKKARNQYAWMPFGEGPRICIGIRFGVLQAKIGIIQLLKRYRFTFAKKIKYPVEFKNSMIVQVKDNVILKAEKL